MQAALNLPVEICGDNLGWGRRLRLYRIFPNAAIEPPSSNA